MVFVLLRASGYAKVGTLFALDRISADVHQQRCSARHSCAFLVSPNKSSSYELARVMLVLAFTLLLFSCHVKYHDIENRYTILILLVR